MVSQPYHQKRAEQMPRHRFLVESTGSPARIFWAICPCSWTGERHASWISANRQGADHRLAELKAAASAQLELWPAQELWDA